jgi:hypothetical protein
MRFHGLAKSRAPPRSRSLKPKAGIDALKSWGQRGGGEKSGQVSRFTLYYSKIACDCPPGARRREQQGAPVLWASAPRNRITQDLMTLRCCGL